MQAQQGVVQKMNTSVVPRFQSTQNMAIENKEDHHRMTGIQRMPKGCVV